MEHADADPQLTALAHRRRRAVVACVREHNVVALADLADELVVEEHGTTIDGISAEVVTELYLCLYHQHIPTLEDAGLVTYNQERDLVTITQTGTSAHTYLEERLYQFNGHEPRPSHDCPDEGSC
ncbi:DUF7344 domain-containing protein [Natronococcus roseus]